MSRRKKYYGVYAANGFGVYNNYDKLVESQTYMRAERIKSFHDKEDAEGFALVGFEKLYGMRSIASALQAQGTPEALSVYGKLWSVFAEEVFRDSEKRILPGNINVVSFQGIDQITQKISIELFLASLLRKLRTEETVAGGMTLVIDEFQHASLKRGSALYQLLTEGRKYGLSLILATQSLTIFSKSERAALDQAAVRLYFRQSQSDLRKVAQFIDEDRKDFWLKELKRLKVGDAVAVGDLCLGGTEHSKTSRDSFRRRGGQSYVGENDGECVKSSGLSYILFE